ncbi:MAG TPA: UDP-N-acetylmuramoyl-tripeptide--D-alanyl-D-alanine ligase [Bacteroidales bacterium]|jgi:UDP-N-acetylmuramoyl-tripeptide--D-alanyl-D-alanine ligase|nr:UDP-N-acetylmuramoyl-tripeptide--D-alanyl-D-alanine ligase [Bacteroidales bacterium]
MDLTELYRIFRESAGVSTDSRSVKKGELFFALRGQNYNGNIYVSEAVEKGASFAVTDDPAFNKGRTVLVENTLESLKSLAAHHRKVIGVPVLGITGSNGKTTTKELIAGILSKKLKVHYTKGNFNNDIGLPLTILSAPYDTEIMVLEMGANHIGEIRALCNIAMPDYGIITNIGTAHIEGFGSFEGVIRAKTELYEYLSLSGGIAIFNDKNPLLLNKIYSTVNKAVPYSFPSGTELRVEALPSPMNLKVNIKYRHFDEEIQTGLFGAYNMENVKAATAAGLFLGVKIEDISEALAGYQPGNNRSQIRITQRNTLVCDSYNANPTSMLLSVKSFFNLSSERKVLILGDMLELGESSGREHKKIVDELTKLKPEKVILVGKNFIQAAAGSGFLVFEDLNGLTEYLVSQPISGSHILIKGSRGIALERIYDFL